MELISHVMIDQFVILTADLTVPQALSLLAAGQYGIVLDQTGQPDHLILAEDLPSTGWDPASSLQNLDIHWPPTLLVGEKVRLQDFLSSPAITILENGGRGAIVLKDEGISGVLRADQIYDSLGSGTFQPAGTVMGLEYSVKDAGLGGSYQIPIGSIQCSTCQYPNKLAFVDYNNLPFCQNPSVAKHTLAP
jgi:hypothetical protein